MKLTRRVSDRLPDFPWDTIAEDRARAFAHPDGVCDLSVGTPVDVTPAVVQYAMQRHSNAHGYPTTWGTPELRASIITYMCGRWHTPELTDHHVLPVIGTKEVVASLPTHLGLGAEDTVVIPTIAYPTYEVGARLAGCQVVACDDPDDPRLAGVSPSLIWINSPANPHGAVMEPELLKRWVAFARAHGAVLASDECYGEFFWGSELSRKHVTADGGVSYSARYPVSVLDEGVCGGSTEGLLVVNSLSKRSNFAGYRGGYLVGDTDVIGELLEVRKHAGLMVPTPVQAAMKAALDDRLHVKIQRRRYSERRTVLKAALERAGFRIDHSEASLYLWATRGEPGRTSVSWLAERGILVAPGDFYGPAGADHVRVAFTAIDERIQAVAERLR